MNHEVEEMTKDDMRRYWRAVLRAVTSKLLEPPGRKWKKRALTLERQLEEERQKTRISAMIEEAGLPKCSGPECIRCVHLAWSEFPTGQILVLGCGRHASCPAYMPTPEPLRTEKIEWLQAGLQRLKES